MARFCWCLVALTLMFVSTVIGQKLFPGRCGMAHPCAQICRDVPGMGRVKCECESGHILAANGFLCISEEDDTINIDEEASQKVTKAPEVSNEPPSKSPEPLVGSGGDDIEWTGSGSGSGSGSGTDEGVDQTGTEILVPSPMAQCQEFHCQNGGTCYINVEIDKPECHCSTGYEGEMCDMEIEKPLLSCEGFECHNGGTCYINVEMNKPACRCSAGYEDEMCDTRMDKPLLSCEGFECQNGGTCYVNTEENKQACHCPADYEGELCDKKMDKPLPSCEGFECQNNGTCYVNTEENKQACHCPANYEGELCDKKMDKPPPSCEGFECQNNGTCYVNTEKNKQACHCPADYEGELCDKKMDKPPPSCEGFECQNNGTCYVNTEENKQACHCPAEYEGELCDKKMDKPPPSCEGFECQNNGTCYVNTEKNKQACHCPAEYEGELCDKKMDKPPPSCEGFECQNNGTCYINTEKNKQACHCPAEYEGELCDKKMDKPPPSCEGFECQNNGTCYVNTEENKEACHCPADYEGELCDKKMDKPPPSCEGFECQNGGTCFIDLDMNKPICHCRQGFEGETCDRSVKVIKQPSCETLNCQNGGTCYMYIDDELSKPMCHCATGFEGETCSVSAPTPRPLCEGLECLNGGVCYVNNKTDSAMCSCATGFEGDVCDKVVQKPPTSCEEIVCGNSGSCYVNEGTAMCHCPLGYEGDTCQQNVSIKFPSFQSHSYMEFPTPRGLYRSFQIQIDFKPESLNGLLLFCGEQDNTLGDYFSVGLVDGRMQFKYELGGTSPAVIMSTVEVTIGKWHTVTVNRDNWNGWMQVDEEKPVKGKSKGLYSKLTLRNPLYLGGHPLYSSLSETGHNEGFSGCVERLVINNADHDMRPEPRGFAVAGVDVGECSSGLCDEGMCSNGGSCVAQSASRYLCLCPLGTAGPTCEKDVLLHIPSFNGSSHLVHQSLAKNHLSFLEIEVIFRPHEPTGVLLYSGQKFQRTGDFVSLGMSDGHVEFRFDCGSGAAVLRTAEPVTLNEWHIAIASRTARDGTLQVDKRPIIGGMAEGAFTQLTFDGDLYIGGVEDPAHIAKTSELGTSFVGDIQKVIINDKPLDLIDDAIRGANVLNADHPCVGRPCQNRGECAALHATYSCQCPLWYEGIKCEREIEETVEVPSFQGSSYLRFMSDWILARIGGTTDNLRLEFRTWSSDGLILWAGRDIMKSTSDFMALGLDNGMLKWSYNLGGGSVSVTTNRTFNDGEWHTVSMLRDSTTGTLLIDGREGLMVTAPGPMRSLDINNGLFLGGMKDIAELSLRRYTIGLLGCLRNVVLDNVKLDLYQDPSEGRNVNQCA